MVAESYITQFCKLFTTSGVGVVSFAAKSPGVGVAVDIEFTDTEIFSCTRTIFSALSRS